MIFWFIGMLFTMGAFLYASDKKKEPVPWWVGLFVLVAWPFVLGVFWAENNCD